MSNVIQFPRNEDDLPLTMEEANDRILEVRQMYVNAALDDIVDKLTSDIRNYGFEPGKSESSKKHYLFLVEALNAFVCQQSGVPHAFNSMIEETMFVGSKEEFDAKVAEIEAKKNDIPNG